MARIALMLPRLALYGGVEQFAYRLAEALVEIHDVDFICARVETPPPIGVRVLVVGRLGVFRCIKMLWYAFRAEQVRKKGKYDLVISLGKTWNQDILRVGGGPQSIFWKCSEKAWPRGFSRWSKRIRRYMNPTSWVTFFIEKHQFYKKSLVVCVSETVKQWVLEVYPNIDTPLIIYNLPDLQQYTPPCYDQRVLARARFDLDLDQIAIATATSNFALKGTETLIRAMPLLPQNFILVIAGGRNPKLYKNLVCLLGIQNRVMFMGKVHDMIQFYRAMDIFALPTYYDACSNAVLEARACGLRVLTTQYDGACVFLPHSWIIDNPQNSEGLASTLLSITHEPASQKMSIPKNVEAGIDAWLALIEKVLKEKVDLKK